ncbi:YaaC family protein [Aquibacillus kalidii]|uniref:YaaC family protein n=1 Tax=Aquibacillus kalidii TaxID=2762597 RepID=UPI001644D460|nr:YaaC family protein [Aquibacillus kalidii]
MNQEDITNFLIYLQSSHTSQSYLQHCYEKQMPADANKLSYENSYRFLYYLKHGLQFYEDGDQASLTVKPILYFYGMVHLIKACILTRKPYYPENTSMLAHGASTRKRKKQQYNFLQDETKVQHKGLFPYFAKHMYDIDALSIEKVSMDKLLSCIPELSDIFYLHRGEQKLTKIGSKNSTKLSFPIALLDNYHTTESRFIDKISTHLPTKKESYVDGEYIHLELVKPIGPSSAGPFYYHLSNHHLYFPSKRHYFSSIHEVMLHYLVLYNLSMICRYETEWWGDLLHTLPTEDYPFIHKFLSITAKKIPFLLGYFLYEQRD